MITRFIDNQQDLKQFSYSAPSAVSWIFKQTNGTTIVAPSITKYSFEIDSDLIVKKDLYVEGSIYNPSDESIKSHISPLDHSKIELITTLNPIHFQYKTDPNAHPHFGFLAQEVEQIYPELVRTDPHSLHKNVNYQEFIPLLTGKLTQIEHRVQCLEDALARELANAK